jgi:hypothetical protein
MDYQEEMILPTLPRLVTGVLVTMALMVLAFLLALPIISLHWIRTQMVRLTLMSTGTTKL